MKRPASELLSATSLRASRIAALVRRAQLEDDSLDVSGILWLEHLNVLIGSKPLAEAFFRDFVGFTSDLSPSYHFNLGAQQFHLGEGTPHRLTGIVGLAVPSLARIRNRERAAASALAGTQFQVLNGSHDGSALEITCPWGNTLMLYEIPINTSPIDEVPIMAAQHAGLDEGLSVRGRPGIRYVEFRLRAGTARAVGRFYKELFGCRVVNDKESVAVCVGPSCHLIFSDVVGQPLSDQEEASQAGSGGGEGLHICVYMADFKGCYERLKAKGLVWTNPRFRHLDTCDSYVEASASRQFRFKSIVDLDTGEPLLELEHECRALRHYQYMKQVHYVEA